MLTIIENHQPRSTCGFEILVISGCQAGSGIVARPQQSRYCHFNLWRRDSSYCKTAYSNYIDSDQAKTFAREALLFIFLYRP